MRDIDYDNVNFYQRRDPFPASVSATDLTRFKDVEWWRVKDFRSRDFVVFMRVLFSWGGDERARLYHELITFAMKELKTLVPARSIKHKLRASWYT